MSEPAMLRNSVLLQIPGQHPDPLLNQERIALGMQDDVTVDSATTALTQPE